VRICIVGAGAIGGLLGVRLAASGQEVSILARGDNLAAIRSHGLRLIEPDGSVVASQVKSSDDLAALGSQDLVVLSVKAHQLAEVAAGLPLLYHETTVVLTLQNGIPWWFFQKLPGPNDGRRLQSLDPDGALERHIPADRVIGCVAHPAAWREAPGVVRLVEGDRFPVGELDGERSDRARVVAQALAAAGFVSRVVTDIRVQLWVKAWGNLAFNPISALTGATLAEIAQYPPARGLAARMMAEAAEVASALGLHVRVSAEQRIEGAARVGEHKTSMLQDVEEGRRLEVDALVGAFVELGNLVKVPMPATEAVLALVSLLDAVVAKRGASRDPREGPRAPGRAVARFER
jgi:2-dehydropantoate 2-reductase